MQELVFFFFLTLRVNVLKSGERSRDSSRLKKTSHDKGGAHGQFNRQLMKTGYRSVA